MTLTDPRRKLVAGRPALASGSMVPDLHLLPLSAELTEIRVMLPMEANGYSWHGTTAHNSHLSAVLTAYHTDPEAMLTQVFAWTPPVGRAAEGRAKPAKPHALTLDELDL